MGRGAVPGERPDERPLSASDLKDITYQTLQHYDENAESFWKGTKDHDVEQNIEALLESMSGSPPFRILDLGCGPGRDLIRLAALGHTPVGLEGAFTFVKMAREKSGCKVLHQDFLALDLPPQQFDGVFANASLFHVPRQELGRVLGSVQIAVVLLLGSFQMGLELIQILFRKRHYPVLFSFAVPHGDM